MAEAVNPDISKNLLHQVEFYFGDSNYPKDKFLRAQAAQDEEGYVSLAILITFERMKSIGVVDVAQLASILKGSELLQVKEDGTMVKRKTPLPQEDQTGPRSIFSKGWPKGISIEDVEKVFQAHGTVRCVRIRKDKQKEQKGSVFVEMGSPEEAKELVGKEIKYKDVNLELHLKEDYVKKKIAKKKGEREAKRKLPQVQGEEQKDAKKRKLSTEKEYQKGLIIRFTDCGSEGVSRESLKELLAPQGKVAYTDFNKGDTEGYIRAATPEEAQKFFKHLTENKVEVGGKVPVWRPLDGDEEKAYWDKIFQLPKNKGKGKKKGARRKRF